MTKIVEFFGLPGAGKTTLAGKWSVSERCALIDSRCKFTDGVLVVLWLLFHPSQFWRAFLVLCRETRGNPPLFRHRRHLFLIALVKETKAIFASSGCVLVDDGLLQFSLGLYEREITEVEAHLLIKPLLISRQIVIVEAPDEERGRRLTARGRVPRFFLGEEYLQKWFQILDHNYQIFKKIILNQTTSSLVINNDTLPS